MGQAVSNAHPAGVTSEPIGEITGFVFSPMAMVYGAIGQIELRPPSCRLETRHNADLIYGNKCRDSPSVYRVSLYRALAVVLRGCVVGATSLRNIEGRSFASGK
jgi:hypothetical protein